MRSAGWSLSRKAFGKRLFHLSMPLNKQIELLEQETRVQNILLGAAQHYGKTHNGQVPVLRFAGGWVRDKLLGGESKDIDVAIDCMTGKEFYGCLKEYLETQIPDDPEVETLGRLAEIKKDAEKSKHLETANTKLLGLELDLVNLRTETYTEESRNPVMEMGTAEEDAMRRDATINALFYNLNTQKVEDLTGQGLEDMDKKILRTPLDPRQTFLDDPLRILRLIRFSCRLGFSIDQAALQLMKDEEIQDRLEKKISRERILVELQKMLQGPEPRKALDIIIERGLYDRIFTVPGAGDGLVPEVDPQVVARSAHTLDSLINSTNPTSAIKTQLLCTKQQQYWGWLICSLFPRLREEIPQRLAQKGRWQTMASRIARDGLKIDNDAIKVLIEAGKFAEVSEICKAYKRQEDSAPDSPGTKRKRITVDRVATGLAIRRWGKNWRSIALAGLLSDLLEVGVGTEVSTVTLESSDDTKEVFDRYNEWLGFIDRERLGEVWNAQSFRPIAGGGDIAKAVREEVGNVSTGPWMQECVATVFEYQLRAQDEASTEGAISVVLELIKNGRIRTELKKKK